MKQTKIVWLIFLSALLLRLVFLFPQYSGDVRNHLVWGNSFLDSPVDFYSRHFPGFNDANYPPLAIFLFAIFGFLYQTITSLFSFLNLSFSAFPSLLVPLFEHENMQLGFMKLPAIFADLGIGLVLYKIFRKLEYSRPLLITSLFLFNPAVIYVSSVWGQIESVTTFFLIISLYCAFFAQKKHLYLSIFFFAFAALTKQTALWFTPFYLFFWYKEFNIHDLVRGTLSGLALFIFSYLPFGLSPLSALGNYLSTLSGSSDYVSDAAYNFWWYFYPTPTSDSTMFGIFSIRQISIALLITILCVIIFRLKKNYSMNQIFSALFLWSLVVFFLQTRVHERHLAPALVFALLTPGLTKRFFADYFLVSAYHMYNLYSIIRLPFI